MTSHLLLKILGIEGKIFIYLDFNKNYCKQNAITACQNSIDKL